MNNDVGGKVSDHDDVSPELLQTVDLSQEIWGNQFSIDERILSNPLYCVPIIRTPQSRNAYHSCKERMCYGIDGFTVLGEPGMGRRGVVSVIRGYLKQEFPRLTTFEHTISRFRSTKPTGALSALLAAAEHELTGGVRERQLDRLAKILEEQVRASGIRLCVLLLHNSEFASETFCKTLMDLRDSLRLRGVRIFFIHCAEIAPFLKLVGSLKERGFKIAEIRAIFGTAHEITAPGSAEDYAEIFTEIDTTPFGSAGNMTWLGALLPQACQGGFRLASQAGVLDGAIKDVAGGRLDVRMFFEVVRTVIAGSVTQDRRGFNIPPDIWSDAVRLVTGVGDGYLLESGK
uniref:Uncharacterized protein n=1 Tax=Burkholderia sp. (strain CCGE1003) TaxID=640512 RepID=E1TI41_BURSG